MLWALDVVGPIQNAWLCLGLMLEALVYQFSSKKPVVACVAIPLGK